MTRLKDLTDAEKKDFRRLRSAFRRAVSGVLRRKGSEQEMREAVKSVVLHAEKIGWLDLGNWRRFTGDEK